MNLQSYASIVRYHTQEDEIRQCYMLSYIKKNACQLDKREQFIVLFYIKSNTHMSRRIIMDKLKNEKRWCIWKYEDRNGNRSKVPYQDYTTRGASNNPDCWIRYADAKQIKDEHNEVGIGLYLSPREENHDLLLCAIDIDAHHTDEAENQYATEILEIFHNTYIERSPSGNGYHILCYFDQSRTDERDIKSRERIVDANGNFAFYKKNSEKELEIYIAGFTNRFMTVTEDAINTNGVIDQTEELLQFLDRYMQKPETKRMQAQRKQSTGSDSQTDLAHREGGIFSFTDPINIEERLAVARRSKYGQQFIDLYDNGNLSDYDDDHSKADFALVRKLYYWLNGDPLLIDKAFRSSKLMRDKWDEMRGSESYGRLTIGKVMGIDGPVWVPCEQVTQGQPSQWMDSLGIQPPEENVEQVPDTTINGGTITPDDVLSMINEVQDDVKNWDRITVLPLMCGSGKSTAIRYKMRQIIEANNGDGMIIVTDDIDRMRDYVNPDDLEMRQFFMNNSDKITVMKHETIADDVINQRRSPILIMTTQRYIELSHEEIENYLVWEGGQRSLIIVDEQPIFKKIITITLNDLEQVKSAIGDGIANSSTSNDKSELLDLWNKITRFLRFNIDKYRTGNPGDHYYLYYPRLPQRAENPELDLDLTMLQKTAKLLNKYKQQINKAIVSRDEKSYITEKAISILDMLKKYALVQVRKYDIDSHKASTITLKTLQDNYDKYRYLNAKVIVLDGTAEISTSYQHYSDLDIKDCSQYIRSLDRLTLQIYQMRTGKTRLMNDHALVDKVFNQVNQYLQEEVPDDKRKVVFSYKFLQRKLIDTYGKENIDWFGHIKGKNDYRKVEHIIQIGINRYTPGDYFLYELDKSSSLFDQLTYDQPNLSFKEQDELIKIHIMDHNGYTCQVARQELLAELEQNIFRGTIRNSNSTTPYFYYLFIPKDTLLISYISKHYQDLHANVQLKQAEYEYSFDRLRNRTRNGEPILANRIIDWHDDILPLGSYYTYEDICNALELSDARMITEVRKQKIIDDLFIEDAKAAYDKQNSQADIKCDRRKTMYYKFENWDNDTVEITGGDND